MSRTQIRERPDPEAVLPSMRAVQPNEEIAYSERLEQCFLAGVAPHHMKRPPKPAVLLQPGSMMSSKPKKTDLADLHTLWLAGRVACLHSNLFFDAVLCKCDFDSSWISCEPSSSPLTWFCCVCTVLTCEPSSSPLTWFCFYCHCLLWAGRGPRGQKQKRGNLHRTNARGADRSMSAQC